MTWNKGSGITGGMKERQKHIGSARLTGAPVGAGVAVATVHFGAPWWAAMAACLFYAVVLLAYSVFMDGAGPAREWAAAWEAWGEARNRR
jgi:hypothetical protein